VAVIKISLFAEQERETKLDRIGDALSKLAEHARVRHQPRQVLVFVEAG